MKKILILSIAILGIVVRVSAQSDSVHWEQGTFAEVLAKAKAEGKMVFLDFYTVWCGPCKKMDKETYPDRKVISFYNSKFVCMKIDAEKGEGVELKKKYEVGAYPSMIFLSSDGVMLHRGCRGLDAKNLIKLGEAALDPERQLSKFVDAFNSGQRNRQFIETLLFALDAACMPVKKFALEYLESEAEEDFLMKSDWELIRKYVSDPSSREFKFLVKNQEQFAEIYGDTLVRDKIIYTFVNRVWDIGTDTISLMAKEAKLTVIRAQVKESGLPYADRILAECDMNFYNKTEQWAKLAELAASGVVEQFYWNKGASLAHIVSVISEHTSDIAVLEKAVGWVERSIKLQDSPDNRAIYDALLLKLKEVKK